MARVLLFGRLSDVAGQFALKPASVNGLFLIQPIMQNGNPAIKRHRFSQAQVLPVTKCSEDCQPGPEQYNECRVVCGCSAGSDGPPRGARDCQHRSGKPVYFADVPAATHVWKSAALPGREGPGDRNVFTGRLWRTVKCDHHYLPLHAEGVVQKLAEVLRPV